MDKTKESEVFVIGIAGGTGSGKTTVAKKLEQDFGEFEVLRLEQDSYYKNHPNLSLEERAQLNFDHPNAVDFDLLIQNIQDLKQQKTVDIPEYDFTNHLRKPDVRHVKPHHVLIIEGILVLSNETLRDLLDLKIYVETAGDIRILRRVRRDIEVRERSLKSVISQYYESVRPMHKQFVEPSKRYADIIIPEGGRNMRAIDLIKSHISKKIAERVQNDLVQKFTNKK